MRVLVPQPPGMPEHWHHVVVCPIDKGEEKKKKAGSSPVLACVTSFFDEINHVTQEADPRPLAHTEDAGLPDGWTIGVRISTSLCHEDKVSAYPVYPLCSFCLFF